MKVNRYLFFIIILGIALLSSLITYKISTSGNSAPQKYQSGYSIMRPGYWKGYEKTDPFKRIEPVENKDVLKYLDDINRGDSIRVFYKLTTEEQLTVHELYLQIQAWPSNVRDYFWNHVARIYIVDGLHTSGRAECMDDSNTFVIFLSREKLHQSPNDWISDAEVSAVKFTSDKEKIDFTIENSDRPALTLENIIVHELGHIVSLNKAFLPDWRCPNDYSSYPIVNDEFYKNSLTLHRKNSKNIFFDAISYYADDEDKISLEMYLSLADRLQNTGFPSLYGSQNANEYFAEMFYGYMHCIIQKKPYTEKITSSMGLTTEIPNGMSEARCLEQCKKMKLVFEGL